MCTYVERKFANSDLICDRYKPERVKHIWHWALGVSGTWKAFANLHVSHMVPDEIVIQSDMNVSI